MDIFVRITVSYDAAKGFIEKLAEDCDKLIAYEHDARRTHIHFYATNCRIKTDAIKARFKKHLHVTQWDRSNWCFESARDAGCITYMSKGKLDPQYIKGFTQDEIIGYKDRWVERTPETSLPKKSTPTQYDMSMEVYDRIVSKLQTKMRLEHTDDGIQLAPNGMSKSDSELYRMMAKEAINVLHKYRKGFDVHSIQKVIVPAWTKFNQCRSSFVDMLEMRFFGR